MGYTHYWYRHLEIEPEVFNKAVADFNQLLPKFEGYGVLLGDGSGEGAPVITEDDVCFNGLQNCGHPVNSSVVIPWPSDTAGGVGDASTALAGRWFAGALIQARCCDGDCSFETFHFPRVMEKRNHMKPEAGGRYFQFTKTAFRPYDLAVTAFLVIAQHHFGAAIRVKSDGEDAHWFDAKLLCQSELGYGMTFELLTR